MGKISQTGKKSKSFTLIEVIVTIGILSIVGSIVVGRAGKIPNALFLDNELDRVKLLFDSARTGAIHSHKKVEVSYGIINEEFTIESNQSKQNILLKDFYKKKLLSKIKVELPEEKSAYFYPDGTATKRVFVFSYKGHKRLLMISPLTATISNRNINETN